MSYKEQMIQANHDDKPKLKGLKNYFEIFLKIVSLIGLIVLVFGQSYSKMLLHLYGGEKLSGNLVCVNMLRLHCVYIYFLAINGLTESFFNASMSESQLKKHNYRLVLFSIIFLGLAFIFAKLVHIYGFLLANCLNMAIRIFYSASFIQSFFSRFKYQQDDQIESSKLDKYNIQRGVLPNFSLGSVLLLSLVCTKLSETVLYESTIHRMAIHLFIGIFFFFLSLFSIYRQEKNLVSYFVNFIRSKFNK